MKKMKKIFIPLTFLAVFGFANAQAPESDVEQILENNIPDKNAPSNFKIISRTSIQESEIVSQQGNNFEISFKIDNKENVQSNLKYGVQLIQEKDGGQIIVDEKIYPDSVTIRENEKISKKITYQAPSYLKGDHSIWIILKNESGLNQGLGIAGKVSLTGDNQYVEIKQDSCFLTIEGLEDKYSLYQGVDIKSDENLIISCDIVNNFKKEIILTPEFQIFNRSSFNDPIKTEKLKSNINLKAGEQKNLSFQVARLDKPQAYDSKLSFLENDKRVSNFVLFHYIVGGESGTIQTIQLDKDFYLKGETAKIKLFWSGSANLFTGSRSGNQAIKEANIFSLTMNDVKGNQCISAINKTLEMESNLVEIEAPIIADCVNPKVKGVLKNNQGKILDQRDVDIVSSNDNASSSNDNNSKTSKTKMSLASILIIVIIIMVAVFLILVLVSKARNKSKNLFLLLILVLAGNFFFNINDSWANGVTIGMHCNIHDYDSAVLTDRAYPNQGILSCWESYNLYDLFSGLWVTNNGGINDALTSTVSLDKNVYEIERDFVSIDKDVYEIRDLGVSITASATNILDVYCGNFQSINTWVYVIIDGQFSIDIIHRKNPTGNHSIFNRSKTFDLNLAPGKHQAVFYVNYDHSCYRFEEQVPIDFTVREAHIDPDYTWETDTWSACSATCGTGTQTRTVYCRRNDGTRVSDSYCSGTKPASSQSCYAGLCACGSKTAYRELPKYLTYSSLVTSWPSNSTYCQKGDQNWNAPFPSAGSYSQWNCSYGGSGTVGCRAIRNYYNCSGSIVANASSYDSEESSQITSATNWTYSASDTVTKCQYRCNSGYEWKNSRCVSADIQAREYPSGSYSNGPFTVSYGSQVQLKWTTSQYDSCSVSNTGWTGTSGEKVKSNLIDDTTFILNCCIGGSCSDVDSITVNTGGACGSAVGQEFDINQSPSEPPSGVLCTKGTASSVVSNTDDKTWNWTCTDNGVSSPNCQANLIYLPHCGPNGSTNSDNPVSFDCQEDFPSNGCCSTGTTANCFSNNPEIGESVNWTCESDGYDQKCYAKRENCGNTNWIEN